MLTLQSALLPRADEVVAKVLDGEAIMVNVASGIYYNMANVGADVWELLAAGHSLAAIVGALTQRYEVTSERAESDVLALASTLLEEKLVRLRDGNDPPPEPMAGAAAPRRAYETPQLEIFRDIGHLCALDPPMPGLRDLPWKGPTDESSS
jgi:hypothetical protein